MKTGPAPAGLFLYAKDLEAVARFYESLIDMRRLHATSEIVVLHAEGIELVVHAIPAPIAATIHIQSPPEKRTETALKFFFTVPKLTTASVLATALGGEVMAERWAGPGFIAANAVDPEGNIFQIRERIL